MKINQMITFILILLICVIGIKSQETCENYNNQIHEATVVPRQIGVFKTLEITNAVSMTFNTNLDQYFTAELDTQQNEIRISTTESFANYEKDNNSTRTSLFLDIRCSSTSTASMTIRITINATNNYEPEFAAPSYEIKIPTPLAKGTEITAYLGFDDQITATDYDLYDNRITFTLTGSNLFYVESVDVTGIKSTFKAKIFTSQQIIKLENDEVEFTLTATDSYFEPKSSSVKVKVFTDPENIFIESPKFSQPLYKGELEKDRNLKVENIQLDASTYDDNVEFVIATDVYGIFNLTSVGPVIDITLKEGILPEEIFQQKFIDFIIEAKRDGDKSGFTVVVIDISSSIFTSSFEKSLYEGELKEKGQILSIEEIKLSTNESLEETSMRLSQTDAGYFDLSVNGDTVALTLKQDASIEEIMTKNLLFLTVDAIQNNTVVASTNVIIRTVSILIPQLEKNFYAATIENNQLQHESILITEASIDPEEEIEVSLVGTERLIFDAEINGREVQLKIKSGAEVPKDKNFLNVQIQVGVKSSTKKNSAIVICELKIAENPLEFLQFSSGLYEGKISQDLTLSLPEISLNIVENVDITLTGKHANYFKQQLNENKVVLELKDEISIEQFSTDYYLQISIDASRENFTSATSSVIIGIERNSVVDSAFEKSLYIGSIDDQRTLQLENLIIKSDNIFSDVRVTGDDAEYFNASIQNNTIAINLIMNITEDLLLQKSILSTRIVADYEESSVSTNLIVTLPRPDEIKKLAFETSYTSGTILKNTELILEIDEFALNPSNYDDTVQFTLSGNDAQFFNFIQNSNKIQLELNQNIDEEQITSKKFLMLSVIASKEEFVNSEHFVFINVEIFDSSESMFENTLYVGTVDDQRDLHIEAISIISNRTFNNVEIVEDDYEYFKASINQNKITVSLAKNITKDLLIRKSVLSAKVVAKYDDIVISTKIIVTLPRPEDIKKLAFETTYTTGTIKKETEIMLEIGEFSLNPSNYDDTVRFTLSGTDADLFIFEKDSNKIQLKLNQGITEEQISSIKFISISVKATREEFEDAEHFIFINVEIFNSIESSFESSLYVGYIDDQKDLYVKNIVIESQLIFSDVQIIDGDAEYFEASIDQNSITVSLVKNITDELLFQKTILSAKVVAQYNDISMFTNLIVTLPRPDETKKLRFVTSSSMGTISLKDSELILNIEEISLNPSNYDDSVQFELDGNDAHLMSFDRNTNKIQLKLKQGISEEELNSKKVLIFSLIATREGFDIAEHFILINVEIFDPNESMFENALYVGTVDDQRDLHFDTISIISNRTYNDVEIVEDDYEYFKASINQNKITVSLAKNITEDLLVRKSILSAKVVAKYDDIVISTKIIVTLPRPEDIKKLAFETTYTSGTIKKATEIMLVIGEFYLHPSNYDDTVQFTLTGTDADLFSFEQDSNKIQLKLNQGITEEQISTKKFISISVKAMREEFEDAEHFVFINVEIFDSSESMFENAIYVGTVDDQRDLHIDTISIISNHTFNNVEIVEDDYEYFKASINQNKITVSLAKNITEDLLVRKLILSAKVKAQYDDIVIFSNLIVTLPRPEEIKTLKFETTHTSGTIRNDASLALEIDEFFLNPSNYDDSVQFKLTGSDANLFSFEQDSNKIYLKLNHEVTVEQINSKKFLLLSMIATREEFKDAEHFIFINVEIFDDSESTFENNLYMGQVDDQRTLHLDPINIKSERLFSVVGIIGDDSEYFNASITENQVHVSLAKEITQGLLIDKSILSAELMAQFDDIIITTNIIVALPRPDEIQSLKFEKSFSTGKIIQSDLNLELDEVILQTGNYNDNVQFILNGLDTDLFEMVRNANKIQLKLKSEVTSEMLNGKNLLSLTLKATRENFASAEHFVSIYIEKSSNAVSESFDKSLYIGNIDNQNVLHIEQMTIKSDQIFSIVEITGNDSEYFDASIDQNNVTVRLKNAVDRIIFPQKGFLNAQIVAKHENISIYTNLIAELPDVDENQKLDFETPYSVGNMEVYPQTKLLIQEIELKSANYDETVQFTISGSDVNLFEISNSGYKVQLKLKSGINKESFENKEYFIVTLDAIREGFESAEHFIFINILTPEIDESNFDQSLYLGSIDNQKVLHLNPLAIKSEQVFNEVMVADDDFEYFAASVDQNYVTITLIKEITENLLLKTSLLSTKVVAKSGDILISTNIIVTLPKVNPDKILRFESPYYIGTLDQLALDIEDIVLEISNYDETVEFTLSGSDKNLFKFERNQNSIKLSLASDITQDDLQNRVFLTASITATKNDFASAETVVFIHLNVIVDDITPIEFDKVIYTGSLTYDNVLLLDKIALASNETEIQISHKGDHADKFTINHSNLTDIKFDFIPQAIDFGSKFYHFYIEALKFGTPRAYAAVIIEIIDMIQLKFDKVNYFGSFNEQGNLMIDQIPLNSVMTNPDVSFRLTDGQSEYFGLNSTESAIKITKELTIAVENLNFVWFYLEAYGSSYYTARTLIVIDFPQNIDTPIDECYDKLDPTQPYFETGSYSFTIMSDETGLVGQIHAIITDPDDLISSYGLLFENIFLYDKITINKGDIKLLVPIPAGFYRMKGIALSLYSQKSAETSILLRVLETKACEDGKPVTTVQKSLAIVKIEENENHHQIMYMMIGDCNYEIIKVVPDALKSHLEIDNTSHYLKNTIQFDREDRIFANYSVPQLQVTLHLICPTSLSRSNSYSIQPFMNDVFTDEILYSPSITYLNLEILDQNDNAPIFTNPPNMNYRVAFPDEDLIALIMPKYLFKVEAYDIDDGLNAVIRYSTSMPSTFEINSVTGEINPLRTLPDEQTRLLITAIDREGAGLRATTSIEFIKISSTNVIEIVANNFAIKNVDELALEISEKLNADFRVLSSSQLPFTTNSQVLRFADTQAKTKIYGYAFKSNSLELITPNELMDQLKELDLSFSINYSTVDGCSHHNNNEGDCDLTVWIFVVSFMGTFILFILIAIPVFWYCYLKKKLLNKDSNSQSSKEEIANHFYDNDSVRDSDIASEIVEAITEMRASDADIVGIGVDGVTEGESSTDTEKLSNRLMSILEPSSPIHDRKVKFNEMVERIEVIDDPDPDTDETPKHKRY